MTVDGPRPPLTVEEKRRLERAERSRQNKRGRVNPATMPDRIARTSAFAPRRYGLITDSTFRRIYEVPGYSVVEVTGRELGSHHRDALVAVFRLPRSKVTAPNPDYRPGTLISPFVIHYQSTTTWRDLLTRMGRVHHVRNIAILVSTLQEISQVNILVHEGKSIGEIDGADKAPEKYTRAALLANRRSSGSASALINSVSWKGLQLDSVLEVRFGSAVLDAIEKSRLVSVNADVQFRLKSDFAKSFWPFIDSQPNHSFIDEERLAQLSGVQLNEITSARTAQFRKDCRQAFDDMVKAGGLKEWRREIIGAGRQKFHRYHYRHALPRQMDLFSL